MLDRYMDYERKEMQPGATPEQQDANVRLLADGVKGASVILLGSYRKETVVVNKRVQELLKPGEWVSGIELYDNGAANLLVRNQPYPAPLVAVIRLRYMVVAGW